MGHRAAGTLFARSKIMPKPVPLLSKYGQPIHWTRALICGVGGAATLMAFMDIFNMLGITQFSFEVFLGSLITGNRFSPRSWIWGVFGNWVVGAVFGMLYAYFFEYVLRRANTRVGALLGLGHAVLAATVIFPFFYMAHRQVGTGVEFGFFGSALDPGTPILLFTAHVLFGIEMGLFYGPVRSERIRMHDFEPGESGLPGDQDVIREEDNPVDRIAV